MERKNHGKSHKELLVVADKVLSRSEDVTNEDIKIATDSGMVSWDIDSDYSGYYPVPTEYYNEWARITSK